MGGGTIIPSKISIHALHAECDRRERAQLQCRDYFNPRTPCGVRPCRLRQGSPCQTNFNPRTPCGVRPAMTVFQNLRRENFNPRTPCGVRLQINANLLKKFPLICISFSFKSTINSIYSHIWDYTHNELGAKDPGISCSLAFRTKIIPSRYLLLYNFL